MNELKNLTYGFVGLGLMGGSLAKAIREYVLAVTDAHGKIYACDADMAPLELALKEKIIDKGFDRGDADAMLLQCDFVYICLYPHATLNFLREHRNSFREGSIVTDISGVKTFIMENLYTVLADNIDFIPGHPMAGSEREGYIHSSGTIFNGRNYILMPQQSNTAEHLEIMKNLVTAIGFSRIIETDYKTHDHKIAFTSQLCHVIASALVDSAEDDRITAFGGGSYEDLTRIAMINAPLWAELFLSNKKELLDHICAFEEKLDRIKSEIREDDKEGLRNTLERVRTKRINMACIDTVIKD
jgi:prephenate dehydrogenase